MASQIDTSKPAFGNASTADERQNWAYAKGEIEALQDQINLTSGSITTGSIELGHASDTTITRTGAGTIAVEGATVLLSGAALATPSGGTLTNCTGLPSTGVTNSVNAQTGTTYTVVATDVGKTITLSNASPVTVTVDSNNITFSSGQQIHFLNLGAGAVTIQGGGTVAVTISQAANQTAVLAQYKGATLHFTGDTTAVLIGGMGAA